MRKNLARSFEQFDRDLAGACDALETHAAVCSPCEMRENRCVEGAQIARQIDGLIEEREELVSVLNTSQTMARAVGLSDRWN